MGHQRQHKTGAPLGFPPVPPADRIMAELPNLEQAVQQLRNRAARQRRSDSPPRAAKRAAFVEAATADAGRLSSLPVTERGLAEWSVEDLLRPPTDGA